MFDAVVFPGQGAQRLGMGQDFKAQFPEAAAVFSEAASVLGFDVAQICAEDEERLGQTEYTQPCILATEIAMYRVLQAHYGLAPQFFAGHSLGEYTALVAAGVMPFEVALRLVHVRGRLMQSTTAEGCMVALIMEALPVDTVAQVAHAHNIDVANDNSAHQVVLSGQRSDMDVVVAQLEQQFGDVMRKVSLPVSAPFHSRYMRSIEADFRSELMQCQNDYAAEHMPKVVSNFLGGFYKADVEMLIDALTQQLSGSVQWRANMAALVEQTDRIIEVGPNRPLRGFFKTIGVDIAALINVRMLTKVFPAKAGAV